MPQKGLIEAGNVDLYAQPKVKNADGSTSTVDSRGYDIDGRYVVLPSVTPDGRHLQSDDAIVAEYNKTGRHLGIFKDQASGDTFARGLHNEYAAGKYERRMSDQAAEKVIYISGVGTVAFPDSMTDAQINAASTRLYQDANPGKKQPPTTSWVVDKAVSFLPTAGAIIGGALGSSGGPLGTVAGAALGGAGGEAWKQNINRLRGAEAPATATDAALAIGKEGAVDAALAGTGSVVAKGAKYTAPVVGRTLEAAGGVMQDVGASNLERVATGAEILRGLFTGGGLKGAALKLAIPAATRVGGRIVSATGRAMQAVGSEAAPAALSASERAAQIPLRERLAQIPLQDVTEAWQAAKAATPNASIADDVSMVRALVSQGFNQETAIKIASGGSKDAAAAVKAGWMQSLKAKGAPIPEAAMKASGKIPPAVSELMESPTFKALAASVANRTP